MAASCLSAAPPPASSYAHELKFKLGMYTITTLFHLLVCSWESTGPALTATGDSSWCDTLKIDFTHRRNTRSETTPGLNVERLPHTLLRGGEAHITKQCLWDAENRGWNMYEVLYSVSQQWWCHPLRGFTSQSSGEKLVWPHEGWTVV